MPTETPTLIPTETPTPTITPSPTANYYIEVVTPAGEPARIERTVTIEGYVMILLLAAILISQWLFYFFGIRDRRKGG